VFALLTSLKVMWPEAHFPGWYERVSENLDFGELVHLPAYFAVVLAVAGGLTSFGGGYITGRAGLVLLVGGIIGHWVVTPLVVTQGWMPTEIATELGARAAKVAASGGADALVQARDGLMATWAYRQVTRPLGIGLLLGGSIASIILTAPMLVAAVRSIQKQRAQSATAAASGGPASGPQELNPMLLWVGIGVSFIILTLAGIAGGGNVSLWRILVAAVVATIWMWLANIIVSIATGKTDNSPLSGMALITIVLIVSILGREGALVALLMAVSVCVATSQGSDMMQDLKTGHLVGAVPRKQQICQLAVAWIGPIVSIVTLVLLSKRFVFGNDPLTAPQGQAIKAALEIFVPPPGTDEAVQRIASAVPWRYAAGALAGLLVTLGAGGGLGVVLGLAMYLPMSVTLTYCIGCFAAWISERTKGAAFVEDTGIPLAAGFLVGEGLAQVCVIFFDLARSALALGTNHHASYLFALGHVSRYRDCDGVWRHVAAPHVARRARRPRGHRCWHRDEAHRGRSAHRNRRTRARRACALGLPRRPAPHHACRRARWRCARHRNARRRSPLARLRARQAARRVAHQPRP
jgi:uncharacterized oligopeptide transporter (OPT) family protein